MSINNDKLVQTGLFGSNSKQSEGSIVNDRRTAPVLSNISTCVAVSVTEPKPFFPIVGFEKNSNGKNAPVFSEKSIGYEVFLSMPKDDGAVKLISLVVPTIEIANKIQFRHLYQLVNPRGKYKYKSFDVIEVWAEDVKEVSLK
ncbi:hypothetical protein SORDD17_01220 [Streptococcus oralis]|uniref:Uncharacterized protein n=1 Tax=Streptococcus oralis TaxID=1303 RepID=A0A139RKB3_STROR|nr:hypothetical protein [Streptococcus oralis]KXU15174.1 hypothetical protein SORDD17_01220 [Streptococcus oralis]